MIDDDRHIEIAAETFLEGMAHARLELLRILTDNAIDRILQANPELSHDEMDRKAGNFAAAVAVRIEELQAERSKLKPIARA